MNLRDTLISPENGRRRIVHRTDRRVHNDPHDLRDFGAIEPVH